MTPKVEPEYTTSTMVSLDIIKLLFIAADLQGLQCCAADVTNAYIQAYTKEKIYTIAGPEFGELAGRIFLVDKALYGLQTSGNCWHAQLVDDLMSMGFIPSKANIDLWMRKQKDHYEYIAVFVDDLLVFSKKPGEILATLKKRTGYELKNVGPPEYYNGADMQYDKQSGFWEMSAKTYIKNTCEKIETLFNTSLKNYGSPLEGGDHPETDDSDPLEGEGITKYQMLVGCAQWAVTIGRYDIQYATNTMARFGGNPREGHLKRMMRIFGYLKHHPKHRIRFDTSNPDYSRLHFMEQLKPSLKMHPYQ